MKSATKVCLILLGVVVAFSLFMYIPIWRDDATARQNRRRIDSMVKIGQNLSEAEQKLRDVGFRLVYREPIKPTVREDYLHQLVVIGDTRPNSFETFAYVTRWSWVPFTHSESPYLSINASLDGVITEIQ